MLLGRNFDDIDDATMQELIRAGASESVHLEFKRESYGKADKHKKELLKDITAFANTLGGHLIIGMNEKDGAASELTPLSNVHDEISRLENITAAGVEPKILGLRMKHIDVEDGSVIIIYVPRSFNPPHRVIFKNSNRYYTRNSAAVNEMSLDQLRMLFGEQRSTEERAKTFVGERFLRIQGNDGAMPLPTCKGVLVMHLVPLPDFGAARRNDVSALRALRELLVPFGREGCEQHVNLEGYCVYSMLANICRGYTQIFRDGLIEATTENMIEEGQGQRLLKSGHLPRTLIHVVNGYMKAMRKIEASPPVLLQISAMNVQGVQLGRRSEHSLSGGKPYERDVLHLPSTMITEYCQDGNYETFIAEQMNFLWNVFGFERCDCFNDEGEWIGG